MRLLDYDPHSGIETYWEWDNLENRNVIHYKHRDLQPALDYATALRNDDDYSKAGIKKELWHYCFVPDMVLMEMFAKGIDINQPAEIRAEVDKNYPNLKVTSGVHA